MPKVQDVKQYWSEIAARAGIDAEKINQVAAAFDDPLLGKVFKENFKPLPDYSHDMETVRDRTKKETSDAWLAENQTLIDRANAVLAAAQGAPPAQTPPQQAPAGLTKDQVAALAEERAAALLSNRDANYMTYLEIREDHMQRFGKPLNRGDFEKAIEGSNGQWGKDLRIAYEKYIEPQVEQKRQSDFQTQLAKAREEGRVEGYSMKSMPTDSGPKQFSPMFDQKQDVVAMKPEQRDEHARNAFFEAYREAKNKTA